MEKEFLENIIGRYSLKNRLKEIIDEFLLDNSDNEVDDYFKRIVLINGDKGAGKTILLKTLKDELINKIEVYELNTVNSLIELDSKYNEKKHIIIICDDIDRKYMSVKVYNVLHQYRYRSKFLFIFTNSENNFSSNLIEVTNYVEVLKIDKMNPFEKAKYFLKILYEKADEEIHSLILSFKVSKFNELKYILQHFEHEEIAQIANYYGLLIKNTYKGDESIDVKKIIEIAFKHKGVWESSELYTNEFNGYLSIFRFLVDLKCRYTSNPFISKCIADRKYLIYKKDKNTKCNKVAILDEIDILLAEIYVYKKMSYNPDQNYFDTCNIIKNNAKLYLLNFIKNKSKVFDYIDSNDKTLDKGIIKLINKRYKVIKRYLNKNFKIAKEIYENYYLHYNVVLGKEIDNLILKKLKFRRYKLTIS